MTSRQLRGLLTATTAALAACLGFALTSHDVRANQLLTEQLLDGASVTQRIVIRPPGRYIDVPSPQEDRARQVAGNQANQGNGSRGGGGGGGGSGNPAPSPPAPPEPPEDPSPEEVEEPAPENNTATCPATGKPVVISTGEKLKPEFDIPAGSSYGLGMERTYRSFNTNATFFGPRWSSTYDYPSLAFSGCDYLPDYGSLCIPKSVTLTFPGGASYKYTRTSGAGGLAYKVLNSTAMGRIIYQPYTNWAFTLFGTSYTYSTAGAIQSVKTQGGATLLQYSYGTNPFQPTQVANAAGQTVQFTWSGNRVATVRDPAGNNWSYAYNASGMLASVTSPGASPDVRSYHYENAANATLLTGVSINGVRYSTYGYYADGRVQVSGLAGGEEQDSFSYGANTWAAAGFEDTLLRWNLKPEVGYGNETAVQPGVQA